MKPALKFPAKIKHGDSISSGGRAQELARSLAELRDFLSESTAASTAVHPCRRDEAEFRSKSKRRIRPFARILRFNETFTGLPEIRSPRASNTAEVTQRILLETQRPLRTQQGASSQKNNQHPESRGMLGNYCPTEKTGFRHFHIGFRFWTRRLFDKASVSSCKEAGPGPMSSLQSHCSLDVGRPAAEDCGLAAATTDISPAPSPLFPLRTRENSSESPVIHR
ncbi:unnamed protein product [Pleuronectes platessa]|uniref:Uncharacterized protein n=1 Tax=Pleuronectes platessa TaxID=8262 RepID=A0A9N7TP27_PLEPL|nr:unnamed protein product [Pleuronectes platessa]